MTQKSGFFKPKAHILKLLGEELIKSPVMAIYELIKNSYDADAMSVNVDFLNPDDNELCKITIEDDGYGINENTLLNVWLEPGSDHRKPFNNENKRQIIRTPFYDRVPMGEKGIGRFAVHRLANFIKLVTRPKLYKLDSNHKPYDVKLANYEIELNIDWDKFRQTKYLSDVEVYWHKKEKQSEFHFPNNSGTFIELSGIKESWNRRMALVLHRDTLAMLSPNADKKAFQIKLSFHNEWLKNTPDIQEVLDHAPFKFVAMLSDDYNLNFDYIFNPKHSKIDKRKIKNKTVNIKSKLIKRIYTELKNNNKLDIENYIEKNITERVPFGPILFEIKSFNLDSKAIEETFRDKISLKNIVTRQSGIKVYKGDLRVYNYGEPGNDWLGLDLDRVQRRKGKISNNQNIGYVQLQPEDSMNLIENTNREGFLENEVYKIFNSIIGVIINEFLAERFSDQDRWMKSLEGLSEDDVRSDIEILIQKVDHLEDVSIESKESLKKEIKKIDKKIEDERQTLLIPAMLGMSTSMAVHELEKLVPRMQDNVKRKPLPVNTLSENIDELDEYVGSLVEIIRRRGFKKESVKLLLEKVIDEYSLKLKDNKIVVELGNLNESLKICCERRSIMPAIRNIVDNSIYWVTISRKEKDRFIYLNGLRIDDRNRIIIADNGNGFEDNLFKLVKPFFTRKPDGMGIGLYLVDQVMMSHGKLNIIKDKRLMTDYGIPLKYQDGAVVELIFDKEKECKE